MSYNGHSVYLRHYQNSLNKILVMKKFVFVILLFIFFVGCIPIIR